MTNIYKGVEIPQNDDLRVEAVAAYEILDTSAEREYDDVTTMAAQITGCPISYISIFDKTRSWLKSSYGLPPNRPPRPRELSMCAPTICQRDMMVIEDLRQHPRYANLPAVVNPPHARFYCGVPLINRDAYALGTLCVWSPEEVRLDDAQLTAMQRLARITIDTLERRRDTLEAETRRNEIAAQLDRSRTAIERAEAVVYSLLPQAAAARVLVQAEVPPRVYEHATVICIRLHGLEINAAALVLERMMLDLEPVLAELGLEKIGLSGDALYALAITQATDRAQSMTDRLLQISEAALADQSSGGSVSGGVATGSVLALMTGEKRIGMDYWGQPISEAYRQATGS
ncbi:MAG: GAF domain-containing protein [Pseudomonadota bacterium]